MPVAERARARAGASTSPAAASGSSTRTARWSGYAAVDGDELTSLYVDPAAQGAGVGSALLADAQRAHPRRRARARVALRATPRTGTARAFYERHGWVAVGGLLGEGALARPRPALRARALMAVLVAVTDHAVERFRQRIGGRTRRGRRAPGDRRARDARVGGRARRRASRRPARPARAARSTCATSSTARWSSSAATTARRARSSWSRCGRPRAARRRRASAQMDRRPATAARAEWYGRRAEMQAAEGGAHMAFTTHLLVVANRTVDSPELLDALRARAGQRADPRDDAGAVDLRRARRGAAPPATAPRRASRRPASSPRRCSATPTRSSPSRRRGTPAATTRSSSPRSPTARRAGCRSTCRTAWRSSPTARCATSRCPSAARRRRRTQPPPERRPMLERVASLMRSGTRSGAA